MSNSPRTFRLTGRTGHNEAVKELLRAQGFRFEPLPFYADAMLLLEEPLPLGSSLAARFGHIYIQDASSMLPALALAALGPGRAVLDMCSSPGGKSGLLARALSRYKSGFVLANEPGVKRLSTLRRNLQTMNLLNAASCSFPGEAFPLPTASGRAALEDGENGRSGSFAGWDGILLDPPCSGWGTAEKNPQVLSLWQGDKLKPLVGLQKMLLREAVRMLKPGGRLVYSTCTVNVQENEEQIRWALSEFNAGSGVSLSLLPLEPYPGFVFEPPWPSGPGSGAGEDAIDCRGVLRVSMDSPLGQGFFIAALEKSVSSEGFNSPATGGRQGAYGGTGPKRERKKNWRTAQTAPESVPRTAIDSELVCSALLPEGQLFLERGNLVFYPQAGLELLPASFSWSGFPLGRSAGPGFKPKIDTALHALMPTAEEARALGAAVLDLEEIAPVMALTSGQSLPLITNRAEAGLYYRGLPLCRLKARGNRVFI